MSKMKDMNVGFRVVLFFRYRAIFVTCKSICYDFCIHTCFLECVGHRRSEAYIGEF